MFAAAPGGEHGRGEQEGKAKGSNDDPKGISGRGRERRVWDAASTPMRNRVLMCAQVPGLSHRSCQARKRKEN